MCPSAYTHSHAFPPCPPSSPGVALPGPFFKFWQCTIPGQKAYFSFVSQGCNGALGWGHAPPPPPPRSLERDRIFFFIFTFGEELKVVLRPFFLIDVKAILEIVSYSAVTLTSPVMPYPFHNPSWVCFHIPIHPPEGHVVFLVSPPPPYTHAHAYARTHTS